MLLCVMFSNRSQRTKNCGKNKVSGTRATDNCVTDVFITFWRLPWSITEQTHGNIKSIFFTAISRKVVGKTVPATSPKSNMGHDQYTVLDDCSCQNYFCCFPLARADTFPWPFVPILSNFFEKKRTQNHPQCLSGLSRALFPTNFLEIAINNDQKSNKTDRTYLPRTAWLF